VRRRGLTGAAAFLILTLVLVACTAEDQGDGNGYRVTDRGVLRGGDAPGWACLPVGPDRKATYGFVELRNPSDEWGTIDAVRLVDPRGVKLVGARIVASSNEGPGALRGFPPGRPGSEFYEFVLSAEHLEGYEFEPDSGASQIIMGLELVGGRNYGHFRQFAFEYHSANSVSVLRTSARIALAAPRERCRRPPMR